VSATDPEATAAAAEHLAAAAALLDDADLSSWELRDGFHRCAMQLVDTLGVATARTRLQVGALDLVVGRTTFVTGAPFEVESLNTALRLVDELELASPPLGAGTFVDLGANIGTTVIEVLARYPAARAVAAEPAPGNFSLLRQNVIANGVEDRVALIAAAISDTEGDLELDLDPENSGAHQVVTARSARSTTIPGVTVDRLVADGVIDPGDVSLLWIDSQGHEAQILDGAAALLAHRPPAVVEYWPQGLQAAGGLERLHEQLATSWTEFVDLEDETLRRAPTSSAASLADRYSDGTFTELLLIP